MSKIKDFLKSPLGTVLCAAAACLLAVVLVWLAAVRPNNDKSLSERISDDYSQYSAELDEANGAAQTFDTDNDLLAMAFVFGTSNGQPTGELHLELADADTGEVLARSTGDMANIVAGQYTGMGLDTPVTGSAGRRYRVTLKPEYTGSGRLTVGCSNGAVLWNDTFTVNGEAVDGTLALLVTYKQIGGFFDPVLFAGRVAGQRCGVPWHLFCHAGPHAAAPAGVCAGALLWHAVQLCAAALCRTGRKIPHQPVLYFSLQMGQHALAG